VSRIVRRRPSAGLVVALVALFIALGSGGAYAAFKLPANSVGSEQLKNHSVGPAKLSTWVDTQLNKVSKLNTGKSGTGGTNGTNGTSGTNGTNGAGGAQGQSGSTGTAGPQGQQGAQGQQGQQGVQGQKGVEGPQGQAGAASLLTWTYGDIQVPDTSGACGNEWAVDTYDTAMEVTPQADGSYLVTKYLTGSFTTLPKTDQPNPTASGGTCGADAETGGILGTFQGIETWKVGSGPTNFDPTASCTACSSVSSSEAQNADFMAAYFPGSTYSGVQNYDFVYHTVSNGSWVHSNTPDNNTGNITG
jgi:Collagen triple helix repeat (20 copies)